MQRRTNQRQSAFKRCTACQKTCLDHRRPAHDALLNSTGTIAPLGAKVPLPAPTLQPLPRTEVNPRILGTDFPCRRPPLPQARAPYAAQAGGSLLPTLGGGAASAACTAAALWLHSQEARLGCRRGDSAQPSGGAVGLRGPGGLPRRPECLQGSVLPARPGPLWQVSRPRGAAVRAVAVVGRCGRSDLHSEHRPSLTHRLLRGPPLFRFCPAQERRALPRPALLHGRLLCAAAHWPRCSPHLSAVRGLPAAPAAAGLQVRTACAKGGGGACCGEAACHAVVPAAGRPGQGIPGCRCACCADPPPLCASSPPPGSIRKSNPGLELGVITVPGELPPGGDAERWLDSRNLTRIEVPPLSYPNYHTPR